MSNKEIILDAVQSVPDDASWEEIMECLHIIAAIRVGQKDIEEGRHISHDEMKKRVASWFTT